MNSKLLEKEALIAREKFENGKINYPLLRNLYQKYNRLDDIDKFIKEAKEIFPRLNCGLATLYLKDVLKEGEIKRGEYRNESHTFLLLKNNIIIDITADQFNGPKVYVGLLKFPWLIH